MSADDGEAPFCAFPLSNAIVAPYATRIPYDPKAPEISALLAVTVAPVVASMPLPPALVAVRFDTRTFALLVAATAWFAMPAKVHTGAASND